jgi:hypothetical protein
MSATPAHVAVTSHRWTVAAVAVIAMAAATVMHEVAGHSGVCLAMGGQIARLTSVYFNCRPTSPWVDAGGPAGSLAGALLGGFALRTVRPDAPRARLLALLLFAFCAFWFSGQLIYSFLLEKSDFIFALKGFAPDLALTPPLRVGAVILGVGLYVVAAQIVARRAAVDGRTLRLAWLAGTLAAIFAAALYAPDRPSAIKEAFFEVGVASFPLLLIRPRVEPPGAPIGPSVPWMIAAGLVYAGFLGTLGLGIS